MIRSIMKALYLEPEDIVAFALIFATVGIVWWIWL